METLLSLVSKRDRYWRLNLFLQVIKRKIEHQSGDDAAFCTFTFLEVGSHATRSELKHIVGRNVKLRQSHWDKGILVILVRP